MGDKSKIEWTDASWTPIRAMNLATGIRGWHCEHVSPGCENCYAESLNRRLGTGLPFKPGHRKDVEIFLDEKMLSQPLRWKKPRMIFVCSMTDLFAEFVPDAWIDRMLAIMALCPQHTFQVLTKRSKRMRDYMTVAERQGQVAFEANEFYITDRRTTLGASETAMFKIDVPGSKTFGTIVRFKDWPLPNVWLGVSAEDQQRADERIPDLLDTPAAVRFVSAEPLLGPIDFVPFIHDSDCHLHDMPDDEEIPRICTCSEPREVALDWIIAGGESGPGFRSMRIEWAETIRQQCEAAGTAYFFKQDSGPRSGMRGQASDLLWACKEFPK